MLFEIGLLFVATFLGYYFYAQYCFGYWKRKGIAHSEDIFPYGSLKGISKTGNIGSILKNKYFESKGLPYYGLHLFLGRAILLRDPNLIKTVLIKEFSTFHDRGFYINTERDPLANHLFFIRGQKWRNMRIKMAPTFTSGKIKMMFQTMVLSGKEMLEHLAKPAEAQEVIAIKDVFAKFTTNIIARCAFGLELDSFKNPNTEFRNVSQFLFKPDLKQSIKSSFFFAFSKLIFEWNVPLNLIPEHVNKFFIGAVDETMKFREENNVQRKDFLQLLMELKNKGQIEDSEIFSHGDLIKGVDASEVSRKFTMSEAAAQAFVFFVAGFETASTTLQFVFYELALNPEIQEKLAEEIDRVFHKNGGELTYETVQEMTYMDQVISETLRKYPPAPFIVRETRTPFKLPGSNLVLEKGVRVLISLLGLHNDPEYFPNPEKFDPDRFSAENKEKITPYCYLPFGDGPRICIGMRFAQMQMKIGLCHFLSKFRVRLCQQSPTPPVVLDPKALLLSLKDEMFLKIVNK